MTRHLTVRLAALAAASSLVLAGCTGGDDPEPTPPSQQTQTSGTTQPPGGDAAPSTTSGGPAALPELGTPYPAPAELTREVPPAVDTLTGPDGEEFALTGVYRLAEDRVVVTGQLDIPGEGAALMDQWEEPGFAPESMARGLEFAPFTLSVEGDDATYLPVREDDVSCLCSVLRAGFEGQGPMSVMTVMSAPAGADRVTLDMGEGYGTFDDVPVTPVPEGDGSVLGTKETLTVREASRSGGTVTARVTLAVHDSGTRFGYGSYQFTDQQLCFGGLTATGPARTAGQASEASCTGGAFPEEAGQAVDLEVTMPDPGTDQVVFLPWNGMPFTMPVEGDAAAGSGEDQRTFDARTRTAGTTVASGEEIQVTLDTSVLFEFDRSDLTPEAKDTLAVAVEALQAQDGRTLTIDGHTDLQGEPAYNKQLSLERAEAVRDALEAELGSGWTFSVNGYGQEQPLAVEKGTPEEIEAAQARNRRVEVTVAP